MKKKVNVKKTSQRGKATPKRKDSGPYLITAVDAANALQRNAATPDFFAGSSRQPKPKGPRLTPKFKKLT